MRKLPVMFFACCLMWPALSFSQSADCTPTPRRDLLPNVIAPMAGEDPIWFIDTTGGVWQGFDLRVKSVWILSRRLSGPLEVTGRLRNGTNTLRFRRGIDELITDRLVITDPARESMIPGGASADVMNKYSFVSSYIHFPAAGCWEIQSRYGGATSTIVVLLK